MGLDRWNPHKKTYNINEIVDVFVFAFCVQCHVRLLICHHSQDEHPRCSGDRERVGIPTIEPVAVVNTLA